ncbi:MAG: response regulator [Streptosporangiales bacterium]|nr:response regulator [Streptosporangiales bacterium]
MPDGTGRTIRVVVCDDHTLFREGIIEILAHEPDLTMVGETDSGMRIVPLARRTSPDVVVLDVEMPGPDAETTIRELLEALPSVRVIVLTMYDEPDLIDRILTAGARAFVFKGAGREELLVAIRGVIKDDGHVVISVPRETMTRLREPVSSPLSPRELEVLTAVSAGLNNAQIANRLFIAEGTVKRHLTNIYMKLEVTTRMNAINAAIAMGLIAPKEPKRSSKR